MTKSDIIAALVAENILFSYEGKKKTFHVEKLPTAVLAPNEFKLSTSLFDKEAVKKAKIGRISGEAVGYPKMIINSRGRIVAVSRGKVIGYKSLPVETEVN